MQRFLKELYARLVSALDKYNKYSPEETARRAQAGRWINWPLYVTQPIIPALFFFLHFTDVLFIILVVLVINVIWIRIVSQHFVSLPLSRLGDNIAHLKWISAPLFGLMLWVEGYAAVAVIAGSWPIVLINILFALHRFWPDGALEHTQRMFRADADRKRVR